MNEETVKSLILFFSRYPLKKYKKGEVLFRPGDNFGGIYFVKKGFFRIYMVSKERKETSIQMFKPLFYFSLISAITGIENRHFMEAMTPVEVWKAPEDEFMKMIKDSPEIRVEVMGSFLKKFVDFTSQMIQTIAGDAYTKIAGLIYAMADEFGEDKGKKRVVKFKITHKQIGSLTGLTRETVTLQMLKLEKAGLIDNDKREIVVEDMSKLRKMLGYE
ncbi:MAG: Transcriptional regulator, Crp/Fnr family [Microgenomates group bacterium GW2011_GWA2_40_6]|nr:MAG: Transcriptional regulator, Crp/Fnr family [Microgenomates group bacterium GW2011_GWA2_40_6]